MEDTVKRFVNSANWDRYQLYMDNFTNLSQVLSMDEVTGRKWDDNK